MLGLFLLEIQLMAFILPTAKNTPKTMMFATATVGPIGVETVIETIRPIAAQSTEITAELIITFLKVFSQDSKIIAINLVSFYYIKIEP